MSDFDDTDLSRDEHRRVAVAEYVLGLGSVEGRAAIARAIAADPALAAEARFWENRFARFNEDYSEVTAPAGTLERIEARQFASERPAPRRASLFDSLGFWRAATGMAAAVAVLAVGLSVLTPTTPPDSPELVASLQPVEGDLNFLARYEEASGQLRLVGSGTPAGTANDYELWFIEGENQPVSLGVVQVGEGAIEIAPELRETFAQGVTLAISREASGGSITGSPQGPIMAAGPVAAI